MLWSCWWMNLRLTPSSWQEQDLEDNQEYERIVGKKIHKLNQLTRISFCNHSTKIDTHSETVSFLVCCNLICHNFTKHNYTKPPTWFFGLMPDRIEIYIKVPWPTLSYVNGTGTIVNAICCVPDPGQHFIIVHNTEISYQTILESIETINGL